MPMPDFSSFIAEYGLPIVFLTVLIQKLGVPIPATPALLVAGALVVDGRLDLWSVVALSLSACMLGDGGWYAAGRYYGMRVLALLCRVSVTPDYCVRQTEGYFDRWGAWTLVLGKFIPGLATVGPPLAGAAGIGVRPFLLLNILGSLIWIVPTVAIGGLFHEQIDDILNGFESLGSASLWLIALLLALYIGFRWWQRRDFAKKLQIARISAEELRRRINSSQQPLVVDVRSYVARRADRRAIPGALIVDLTKPEQNLEDLPGDRDVVFYCSCPNEVSSAHVARKLIDRGYTKVRPLAGGLDAWLAAGYDTIEIVPTPPVQEWGSFPRIKWG